MSAKFVRVHEGKIVFLRAGKVVMVPFEDLVDADQQFLRDDLEKKGQAHLLPPPRADRFPMVGGDDSDAGSSQDGAALPIVQRVWTDVQDRKITAGIVRTEGDNVILLMNGSEVSVPLARLSRVDQAFVRQWTMAQEAAKRAAAARSGGSQLPSDGSLAGGGPSAPSRPPWAPGGPGSSPGTPGSMAGMPGAMPGMPDPPGSMPGYGGASGGTNMQGSGSRALAGSDHGSYGSTPYESSADDEAEYGSSYDQDLSSGSGSRGSQSESYASNMAGSHGPGSMNNPYSSGPPSSTPHASMPSMPSIPTPPTSPAPPHASMPDMYEEVGVCSNCNKEVSDEFGAGDNCPHCGIFFEYEEDEHGNKTKTANSSGDSDVRVSGRSIRGIIKLLLFGFVGVAGLIGWVCRKLFS
jgi:hypothetical protein